MLTKISVNLMFFALNKSNIIQATIKVQTMFVPKIMGSLKPIFSYTSPSK